MKHKRAVAFGLVVLAALVVAGSRWTALGRESRFVVGGALVDAGYGLQDGLESYDFEHEHDITPEQVWQEVRKQNRLSSSVRHTFPRTPRHALVALVVCMDARIDTNEVVGDTRHYYYVIRTAGSVMSEREEEMLELAVENGVKLVLLTTHTDCAAEKAAKVDQLRRRYPALAGPSTSESRASPSSSRAPPLPPRSPRARWPSSVSPSTRRTTNSPGADPPARYRALHRDATRTASVNTRRPLSGCGRPVVVVDQPGERGDLIGRQLDGRRHDDPAHALGARRRRERTVVAIGGAVARQQPVHVHGDVRIVGLDALGRRQVGPDGIERRVVRAPLDEDADHGQLAARGLVHQVHLHRVVPALDRVLALVVEVVLHQVVVLGADGECVAALVVDLNRVAVVDPVGHVLVVRDTKRPRLQVGRDSQRLRADGGLGDVDRRLRSTLAARGELRAERAPVLGAFGALVVPHGVAAGRRDRGPGDRLWRSRRGCGIGGGGRVRLRRPAAARQGDGQDRGGAAPHGIDCTQHVSAPR